MMHSSRSGLCICLIIINLALVQPIASTFNLGQNDAVVACPPNRLLIHAQEIGDNRSFWGFDFDEEIYYVIDAYLLAIGEHCYIYVENSVIDILGMEEVNTRAALYRDEFDTNIFPRVTDLAGDPDGTLGDIDGDPRIFILITEHRMSYYGQTNEIEGSYSNMCEMVYICYYSTDMLSTIAHEFHHLVWFNYEFDEVHFLLEGLAEYASYFAGYFPISNMSNRAPYYLNNPHDSLIYFEVEVQDYGASYLFAFYLAEQYGVQFLRDLVQHEGDGALGVETALQNAGHDISFNELYLDWMTALTIDEPGFANDRYCLRDMDARIQEYTTIHSLPYQEDGVSLYCYGSAVYQISSPPDAFSVEMSQPNQGVAALSIAYKDAHGWHVQQMQRQGRAIVNISGDSVDSAYLVASYLYSQTPTGNIDFSSGDQRTVQILVYESGGETMPPPTIPPEILTYGVGVMALIALIAVVRHMRK
ncbi:MAG: hypothetical protein ACFFET_17410 [Candidatus Thorarchaeota archaeon]